MTCQLSGHVWVSVDLRPVLDARLPKRVDRQRFVRLYACVSQVIPKRSVRVVAHILIAPWPTLLTVSCPLRNDRIETPCIQKDIRCLFIRRRIVGPQVLKDVNRVLWNMNLTLLMVLDVEGR